MAETRAGSRYTRSRLNQVSERDANSYVMGGVEDAPTFDLVLAPPNADELMVANAERYINDLCLIEVKATRKPIRSTALNGFFFGTTTTNMATRSMSWSHPRAWTGAPSRSGFNTRCSSSVTPTRRLTSSRAGSRSSSWSRSVPSPRETPSRRRRSVNPDRGNRGRPTDTRRIPVNIDRLCATH